MTGSLQVREWGPIHTPVSMTATMFGGAGSTTAPSRPRSRRRSARGRPRLRDPVLRRCDDRCSTTRASCMCMRGRRGPRAIAAGGPVFARARSAPDCMVLLVQRRGSGTSSRVNRYRAVGRSRAWRTSAPRISCASTSCRRAAARRAPLRPAGARRPLHQCRSRRRPLPLGRPAERARDVAGSARPHRLVGAHHGIGENSSSSPCPRSAPDPCRRRRAPRRGCSEAPSECQPE